MPYINAERRLVLDRVLAGILREARAPEFAEGDLNYVFTKLALATLPEVVDYSALNAIVGVFECAKQEFYRRAVVPFESKKIEVNGDIF